MLCRRLAALALLAVGLVPRGVQAHSSEAAFVKGRLVQVDVYDRVDGVAQPVYAKDGRNYIVGEPGHEYAVRIRNCSGGRVLVVTSVDGVNVISGATAAPSQSGYVLDPWGSVEIAGWRKSFDDVATFFFTDLGNSYAARTGRPDDVGVIGVAVFEEKTHPIAWRQWRDRIAPAPPMEGDGASADTSRRYEAAAPSASPPAAKQAARSEAMPRSAFATDAERLGKLGTGHGRSEESRATNVPFERASSKPAELLTLQYDRRENLAALGVLAPTPYAWPRQPDPFPGAARFAPDPDR
jgi:hypothetical protein